MIDSLSIAGVIATGYGIFCWFLLPKTPPAGSGKKFSLSEVKGLLAKRSYVVLLVTAFVISSIHTFYFIQMSPLFLLAGLEKSLLLPALSIGQFSGDRGDGVFGEGADAIRVSELRGFRGGLLCLAVRDLCDDGVAAFGVCGSADTSRAVFRVLFCSEFYLCGPDRASRGEAFIADFVDPGDLRNWGP